MELLKLQLFARWGSATILRYVKEAPLAVLTKDIVSKNSKPNSSSSSSANDKQDYVNKNYEVGLEKAAKDIDDLRKEVSALLAARSDPEYVMNLGTKVVHRVLCASILDPSDTWRTACGFRFGLLPHARMSTLPDTARQCRSCIHLVASAGEDSSSSSSDT